MVAAVADYHEKPPCDCFYLNHHNYMTIHCESYLITASHIYSLRVIFIHCGIEMIQSPCSRFYEQKLISQGQKIHIRLFASSQWHKETYITDLTGRY